ncbi:MAG: NAD(P)-binding protein [Planctomycetota bacterium]
MHQVTEPTHVVAIFGGASAGSVAAELLAEHGVQVVVFEQNPRPYGKIEDGLPRWHDKQRRMEYDKINARLARPGVHFVPQTKLGRDVDFQEVLGWGFSAVLLANGAWQDREITSASGVPEALDHGLVYQNAFVYWFNHKEESGYDGPTYEVLPGSLCVGGGLASIDVIKIFQLELYQRALAGRGIQVDALELEHEGIPQVCAAHGIQPEELGVENCTLLYRRRIEDMPLATLPPTASEKQKAKLPVIRQKILEKAQRKFLFEVMPQVVADAFLFDDGGHVRALRVLRTELKDGRAATVEGSGFEIPTRFVVSSIGSIPEPIPGIEMNGAYYRYKDWDTGEYAAAPGVFGLGNVVTGKGNIKDSLDHGRFVAAHVAEQYLGVGSGELDLSTVSEKIAERGEEAAARVAEYVAHQPKLSPEDANRILARAAERQAAVGYEGDYTAWIERVTPADLG